MKKCFALFLFTVMLFSLSAVCFAAPEDEYAPSIENKGAPEITDGDRFCENEESCFILTPVGEAATSSTISEESKELLLSLFEELKEKGTALFENLEKDNLVVRDLFDLSPSCEDANNALQNGSANLTLRLNLSANAYIEARGYVQGAWRSLPARNNGDGTVTLTLSNYGPIALLVEGQPELPTTGDTQHSTALWISMMALSFTMISVLAIVYGKHKKAAKNEE